MPQHFNPIAYVNPATDYFKDMDQGVKLETPAEVNGRNMWLLWTGGDDRFWDLSASLSFGNVDLLKSISSYNPEKDPTVDAGRKQELKKLYKFRRENRWHYLGIVNEPCFQQAMGPNSERYGLWLDRRVTTCQPDPFEDEQKYPGVKIGARGKNRSHRLVLWLRDRYRGPSALPQSGLRPNCRRQVGSHSVLHRPLIL